MNLFLQFIVFLLSFQLTAVAAGKKDSTEKCKKTVRALSKAQGKTAAPQKRF